MPWISSSRYSYRYEELSQVEKNFVDGCGLIMSHPLFSRLDGNVIEKKDGSRSQFARVRKDGNIYVNSGKLLTSGEWAFVLAHCLLHLAFGHFDREKLPNQEDGSFSIETWNHACDIYITRFLMDIKWGEPLTGDPAEYFPIKLNGEQKIYDYLMAHPEWNRNYTYGTAGAKDMDMLGLDKPLEYAVGESNPAEAAFARAMEIAVREAVSGEYLSPWQRGEDSLIQRAGRWFVNHYPLLGGLAASFKIIEEQEACWKYDVQIAAVDIRRGIIFANPAAGLSEEEWRFVMGHEYLHAALQHHKRIQGRNAYLWNLSTDYVINGWLKEMGIGAMPKDVLYDEEFKAMSAEAVYDEIVRNVRKYMRLQTFRGYGKGDFLGPAEGWEVDGQAGMNMDDFWRNVLSQGLDYHKHHGRGTLPAGLIQEIKALAEPPIPWEVDLAAWFDENFPPLEKRHTYARPSRRQGATPETPRPRYVYPRAGDIGRTFAVIIDTSGSMGIKLIAKALGAAASYAVSREVNRVRVVFCDADAYDKGYMEPWQIAEKVEVKGGGGTVLQPAVRLLEQTKDFPQDGPLLIITDAYIEKDLRVCRKHAYLVPKGHKLPFGTKAPIFYFS